MPKNTFDTELIPRGHCHWSISGVKKFGFFLRGFLNNNYDFTFDEIPCRNESEKRP